MLLECRNVSNEQPNIEDQDGDISEWPTTESVLLNACTPDLDQHTHLQDGGCHNKIGPFAASENKSKYSNIEEWINSDAQQSAPQRCEDVRANASPQSTLSTYSDSSLFDREPSAEASRRVKNNAASRRSRACRKQRFQLMQMRVKELDTVNNGLRETLRGLDRLLTEAKEILLQQATKSQDCGINRDNQTFAYLNTVRSSPFQSDDK
ncbi:unnamed protein product [Dibothriocephalus latus]|uniref:BZIP domain-containing protein n=1 Tax=Dibothriocephalus latus TaxID=60516 RepID=A0A3P6V5Y2_DIBLA|nr:unnamed protein product [Dibothriocephalus latus]